MTMKIGTEVVMHTCGEAEFEKYNGKIFVTASEPRDMCGTEVVAINFKDTGKRASPCFATEFLTPMGQIS